MQGAAYKYQSEAEPEIGIIILSHVFRQTTCIPKIVSTTEAYNLATHVTDSISCCSYYEFDYQGLCMILHVYIILRAYSESNHLIHNYHTQHTTALVLPNTSAECAHDFTESCSVLFMPQCLMHAQLIYRMYGTSMCIAPVKRSRWRDNFVSPSLQRTTSYLCVVVCSNANLAL